MADDLLDWFLLDANERRDKQLREDLDYANIQIRSAAEAGRRNADKLRRDLDQVTGTLESRLNRLQRMFGAYVELNSLRDEVSTTFEKSAEQRRKAIGVLTRLAVGQPAERMESDPRYWLPDAINAVTGLVSGKPDPEAEARARYLDPRADEFIVLASTALDRPDLVAARLPDVLVTDGSFSASQELLWNSAVAGDFGDVLPTIRAVIEPTLSSEGWPEWVQAKAKTAGATPLAWVEMLTRPLATDDAVPEPAAAYVLHAGLKDSLATVPGTRDKPGADTGRSESQKALTTMMLAMVSEGLPEEREHLSKIRMLQAVLADPDQEVTGDPGLGQRSDVTERVRSALTDRSLAAAVRRELLSWCAQRLAATIEHLAQDQDRVATSIAVSVMGATVPVTASGYPSDALARVDQSLVEAQREARRALILPVLVAVVAATIEVFVLVRLRLGLAVFMGMVVVGCLVAAGIRLQRLAVLPKLYGEQRENLAGQLDRAHDRAASTDADRAERRGEEAAVMEVVRRRLVAGT